MIKQMLLFTLAYFVAFLMLVILIPAIFLIFVFDCISWAFLKLRKWIKRPWPS